MAPRIEYYYGMRLRGFSPMAQPSYGYLRCLSEEEAWNFKREDGRRYHDVLVYFRPLSMKEMEDYEMDYLQEVGK